MELLSGLILWTLGVLLVGQAILVLGFVVALFRFRRTLLGDDACPWATVVLCLRGSDPDLVHCLSAILDQDYPRYRVRLIVDHRADPAWGIVETVLRDHPRSGLAVVEPRRNELLTCSLKCASLVQAWETLDADCALVAQLDADTLPHRTWLRELATALHHPSVGAVTGNRWYFPEDGAWGAWVRAVWNAAAVVQMYWYRIAWGGTLALKTEAVRQAGLLDAWSHAFCEDTMLYSQLRPLGWRVEFLPTLMMVNRETCDLPGFLGWVRRQLLTARLYHPRWNAVLAHGLLTTAALLAAGVLAFLAAMRGELSTAAWLLSGAGVYQLGVLLLLFPIEAAVRRIVAARQEPVPPWLNARRWQQLAAVLLTQVLYPLALVSAAWTQRVSWRQAIYRIEGPWNIRRTADTPYEAAGRPAESRVSL